MTVHFRADAFLARAVLVALPVLFLLAACETAQRAPPAGQQGLSAQLLTDGSAVFVNGQRGRNGQAIRQGDVVATGPDASALVRFSDGLTVQLDENTDPVLSWTQQRLQIEMAVGLVEVVKGSVIDVVEVITETAGFFARSRFTVETAHARFTRADLFSGRLQMTRPQPGTVVAPGQYALVDGGRLSVDRTSPSRVRELRRRLDRWKFAQRGIRRNYDRGTALMLGLFGRRPGGRRNEEPENPDEPGEPPGDYEPPYQDYDPPSGVYVPTSPGPYVE